MSAEFLFDFFSLAICLPWLLLIAAPRWRVTNVVVHNMWLPLVVCACWIMIRLLKPSAPEGAGIMSMNQLMLLFSSPYSVVMIWVQILLWDLFIGAWILRDSHRYQIAHGWTLPCLLATFITGPLGLLMYLILRFVLRKTSSLNEQVRLHPQHLTAHTSNL